MEWLWLLVILLIVAGFAGLLLPMLPGVPLMFGGLLLAAWIDGFARVSVLTVLLIGGVALLAWLIDLLASVITTRSAGASRQAMIGTLAGAVIGIAGGIPGIVLGTVAGAVIGEIMAHRDAGRAGKVGVAAGLGFVLALAVKLLFALLMLGMFLYAYFF